MIVSDARPGGRAGTDLVAALARALGTVRRARGLRQVDVALLMGTSQSCVSDFERGKANPQLDFVARYAAAVDADIEFHVQGHAGFEGSTFNVDGEGHPQR